MSAGDCQICDKVSPADLVQLNTLLADPSLWPRETFKRLKLPPGPMPRRFKMWGATRTGYQWLIEHGYSIKSEVITRHWRYDVAHFSTSAAEIAEDGSMSLSPRGAAPEITPLNFLTYLQRGLDVGVRALELLEERMNMAEELDEPVPMSTLLSIAQMSASIAKAQGSWAARGYDPRRGREEEEQEGFRAGSRPLPSQRMGHARVHTVDGVAIPVTDEGPRDREHYNERARQEGGPLLPST